MQALLSQKPVKMIFAIAMGAMILSACGSKSSSSESPAQKPATQVPSTPNTPNSITYPALASANMSILLNAQTSLSLANIVKSAGKTVGVFEYVGVTCESCKTETPYVASQLAPYSNSVARVVVFPNPVNEYTSAEYQNFVTSYAQGARYAIDNDQSVLKAVRANNTQYFGLFIIVKADGTGIVLNQSDAVSRVLPAVQAALK